MELSDRVVDRIALPSLAAVAVLTTWEGIKTRPVMLATPAMSLGFGGNSFPQRQWMFVSLAIAALGVLYIFLARASNKRAALYGVMVLATMPAWFVRAGADGSSLAAPVISFACMGLAVLDVQLSRWLRLAAGIGAAIAGWGFASHLGLVVVVAVPALAMGGTYFLARGERGQKPPQRFDFDSILAIVATILGGAIAVTAVVMSLLIHRENAFVTLLLGPAAPIGGGGAATTSFATFVPQIAYALAPWTPFLPFALARQRHSAGSSRARVAIVLAVVLTLAAETAFPLRHGAGAGATLACGAIAASIGALLADLDELESPNAVLAIGVFALGAVIAHDLTVSPDRVLDVLAPSLPTGHSLGAAFAVRVTLWAIAGMSTIALLLDPKWLRFGSSPRAGRTHRKQIRVGRGLLIAFVGVVGGLALRGHTYPDLIARISPGRAFEAWSDKRKAGDTLGLLGVDEKRWPRARADISNDDAILKLDNPENAARWLAEPSSTTSNTGARRFLAIGPSELARLNAAFRAKSGQNVLIVTGHGAFLLGVSALERNEHSENPLDAIVMSAPPEHLHPVNAQLDALEVLGWEIFDAKGKRQNALPARKSAHLRIAARVGSAAQASMLRGYCTFIHIDHTPTRFGAEHREHTYPMSLWREGDIVIDDFAIDLPPHFSAGSYAAYWGVGVLPCQDDRRMHVVSGPADKSDRVILGRVEVK